MNRNSIPLNALVKMWPTPNICGNYNRKGASATSGDGLDTAVRKWPTPTSTERSGTNPNTGKGEGLSKTVKNWLTPKAPSGGGQMERATAGGGLRKLEDQISREVGHNTGQLNPDWVEWLMGWPIGWTSLEPLTELVWLDWSVDPADLEEIPRVATGIKDRVNRLKGLGNGQVPLCAATAWEILK